MKLYIHSINIISPSKINTDGSLFIELPGTEHKYLKANEPDYKEIINPNLIRRMGRVIKMGVASSMKCLKDAGIENPDAIITGTGLGCIEDTEKFLNQIVINNEQFLAPTSFIQSTHNTIAGQIALLLKCHAYNFTFVHRNFSFENAVTDTMMMLTEHPEYNVLLGGVDELTPGSHAILKRLGIYKDIDNNAADLLKIRSDGSIAGEGATFFIVSGSSEKAMAAIQGVKTFYKPENPEEIQQTISAFLQTHHMQAESIDAVMMGYNGDIKYDGVYDEVKNKIFANHCILSYKHLSGEYFTSSAFATGLCAHLLNKKNIPDEIVYDGPKPKKIENILFYNHFKNAEHSLMLFTGC